MISKYLNLFRNIIAKDVGRMHLYLSTIFLASANPVIFFVF